MTVDGGVYDNVGCERNLYGMGRSRKIIQEVICVK